MGTSRHEWLKAIMGQSSHAQAFLLEMDAFENYLGMIHGISMFAKELYAEI